MIKHTLILSLICLTLTACSSSKVSSPQGKTSERSNLPGITETTPPSELTQ